MKLFSFRAEGRETIGAQHKNYLVDLPAAYAAFQQLKGPFEIPRLPNEMVRFLNGGSRAIEAAVNTLAFISKRPPLPVGERVVYGFDEAELLPPMQRPGKILCARSNPHEDPFFLKTSSALLAPGKPIVLPKDARACECGLQIAVVIGEKIRDVSESVAMEKVAGFTLLNDVSVREGDSLMLRGNHDTFCPLGPCITTRDELQDLADLAARAFVNQTAACKESKIDGAATIPHLLAMLSNVMSLEPGDIVGTGNQFDRIEARPGDVVRFEADGIGTLENVVAARS